MDGTVTAMDAGVRVRRVTVSRGVTGEGIGMKLSVVALDFDGTIARDDVLDPEVRVAITELRAKDIVVVLVTGRILDDLKRVTGDLHFVDAVVAENGGVLEFPATGSSVALAAPPPDRLVEAVRADGIVPELGQVIVGTQAAHAPRLLEHIRRFELPLSLAFNRGRVMVLPQAVSKATGLRQALTILRLSPRNAVAIGDAENDHELLRVCEVGVAVSWGSAALQAAADYVIEGAGPSAVAGYLRALGSSGRIPAPLKAAPESPAGTRRRRHAAVAGGAGSQRARRGRPEIGQIMGHRAPLRAVDSSRLLSLRCRSRRGLRVAGGAARCVGVRRR